ncbi:hypothetical protein [Teredinibacter turnerae]|uniref:hypothetical protein n=1 Tax=Teredinibacter turnerae TaxID=2426 RepID=UPI000366314E|nr:hypothetical protein [Teredinibacter turnerae]
MLTSEKLLAGANVCFDIAIPHAILQAGRDGAFSLTDLDGQNLTAEQQSKLALDTHSDADNQVRLRPLSVADLQLINRAGKDNNTLMAALLVQKSLVEPKMTIAEVNRLPVGVLQFLANQVNEISGINASEEQLQQAAEEPLAQAAFILAKHFGWTPQQIGELTLGQVLFNLKMLRQANAQQS